MTKRSYRTFLASDSPDNRRDKPPLLVPPEHPGNWLYSLAPSLGIAKLQRLSPPDATSEDRENMASSYSRRVQHSSLVARGYFATPHGQLEPRSGCIPALRSWSPFRVIGDPGHVLRPNGFEISPLCSAHCAVPIRSVRQPLAFRFAPGYLPSPASGCPSAGGVNAIGPRDFDRRQCREVAALADGDRTARASHRKLTGADRSFLVDGRSWRSRDRRALG